MKIKTTQNQDNRSLREIDEEKVSQIPSFSAFNDDWKLLQKFLTLKGNPKWSMKGDLNLFRAPIKSLGGLTSVGGHLLLINSLIKSLGNLTSVGGYLDLHGTQIESLENLTSVGGSLDLGNSKIKSLGDLTYVGGDLNLINTNIESLGNLNSVGGNLYLSGTPISKKCSEEEIRKQVDVGNDICVYQILSLLSG